VAAGIGKLIGNGPAIWLRLQAAHDAWHAEREVDVSKIPTLEQGIDSFLLYDWVLIQPRESFHG
jgi:plasmid maintenance system antidote protein VapI